MSYLPCTNASCRSYGQPHPNCKCHGGYAEGGAVEPFCAQSRTHRPDCQYFAEGTPDGPVSFDDLPDDSPPKPMAFDDLPADPGPADFDSMPEDSQTYSTPGQQMATVAEGAAQGMLGPAATAGEIAYGKMAPEDRHVPGARIPHSIPGMLAAGAKAALDAVASQGMAPEDIAGRAAANPIEHGAAELGGMGASFVTGAGEAGLISKGAGKIAELANLSKTGANMLKGAITNGLIQGGDEVSKWMLGQGDPHDAAGAATHVGAAALFGLIPGAVGRAVQKPAASAMEKLAETKLGAKAADFLAGFASAASGGAAKAADPLESQYWSREAPAAGEGLSSAYKAGRKAFDKFLGSGIPVAARNAGKNVGTWMGSKAGPAGAVIGGNAGEMIAGPVGDMIEKLAKPASKRFVAPLTLKILSAGNTSGLLDALNHAEDMAKGYDAVARGVDGLFKAGTNSAISAYGSEKDRQKLDDYISNGGLDQNIQQEIHDQHDAAAPQGFAKGGDVKKAEPKGGDVQPLLKDDDGRAMHYPEHNVAISAAKGRVSEYLKGLRPSEHHPRLAFDDAPDQTDKRRSYHRALDLANAPLGIMKEIGDGTIEPEHVAHFNAMYPELNGLVQKQLTSRIVKAQLAGETPSYKVRQGMSLLMGTALSSELTPSGIQAAQAVFAPRHAAGEKGGQDAPPKKSAAPLSKSDSAYLTGNQALGKRQQRAT